MTVYCIDCKFSKNSSISLSKCLNRNQPEKEIDIIGRNNKLYYAYCDMNRK